MDYLTVSSSTGNSIKLTCYLLVGTENSATITWSWKNPSGTTLVAGDKYSFNNQNTSSELTIKNIELNEKGNYYCYATNSYGTHSRYTYLMVKSNLKL